MDAEIGIPTHQMYLPLSTDGSGNSIGFIASTKAGKTHALRHIMDNYFKKHISCLMTQSSQADIYKNFKQCVTAPMYIPKVLKDMRDIQKQTSNHYDFLAILDDVVTNAKFNPEIVKLLTIGRNSAMSAIICVQAVTLMNSVGRTNINFVFLGKLNTDSESEKVVKAFLTSYFPKGMKMVDKLKWYRAATADHFFIVVDTLNGHIYRTRIDDKTLPAYSGPK
jgi:hypothetical protein